MAQCPYTRYRRSYDAYSGEMKVVSFGCGRCAVCLHKEQDSWAIRIEETAKKFPCFIYDTLTLRNSALQWESPDILSDPDYIITPEVDRLLKKYDGCVPVFPKYYVSDWLKRGRDALAAKYGRKNVELKYLGFMEYGPLWSRPHVHLIIFGVSWADYCHYFRDTWRELYGFTKSKYIAKSMGKTRKDIQCIARYVSKYCSKGQFESPLVKAGLIFKPWHVVSQGIGAEYCDSVKFQFLKIERFEKMKDFHHNRLSCAPAFKAFRPLGFSEDDLLKITTYTDDSGYKHALPRYFHDKLLGRVPNLLKYEVQNLISKNACERRDTEVSQIAASLASGSTRYRCAAPDAVGISASLMAVAYILYFAKRRDESQMALARLKNRLKNQYRRPLRSSSRSVILIQ